MTHAFVTMSGVATDETTIEIESKLTQIRWIVFGERVQNTFLSTPDWEIPFVKNPTSVIFNKIDPIRCECRYDVIGIIIPAWIRISSNRCLRW